MWADHSCQMHLFRGGTSVSWELGGVVSHPGCAHIPPGAGLLKAEALPLPLLCLPCESPHRGHVRELVSSPENPSEAQGAEGAEGALKANLAYPKGSPLW